MEILAALMTALENGREGGFATDWDQDDADPGFWIPAEDYYRLLAAVKATVGEKQWPNEGGTDGVGKSGRA